VNAEPSGEVLVLLPWADDDLVLRSALADGLLDRLIQRIHLAGLRLARTDTTGSPEVRTAVLELDALLRDVAAEVLDWRLAYDVAP
jgi:hypothetical protein